MRSDRLSRTIVVLMAHPDDEFAIFPVLAEAAAMGANVHLYWLSDGAYGGQDPQTRVEESLRVLAGLRLAPTTADFIGTELRVPDGEVAGHLEQLHRELERRLPKGDADTLLLVPAWEGGHQDHDAVHLLGRHIARDRKCRVLEFPLYNGYRLRGPLFRVFSALPGRAVAMSVAPSLGARVRFALACLGYRSQRKSFLGLLPMVVFRTLLAHRPWLLLEVDPCGSPGIPHAGKLLYERRTKVTWNDFRAQVGDYLS